MIRRLPWILLGALALAVAPGWIAAQAQEDYCIDKDVAACRSGYRNFVLEYLAEEIPSACPFDQAAAKDQFDRANEAMANNAELRERYLETAASVRRPSVDFS